MPVEVNEHTMQKEHINPTDYYSFIFSIYQHWCESNIHTLFAEFRAVFDVYDLDHDGCITAKELKEIAKAGGAKQSMKALKAKIAEFDFNSKPYNE